MSLQQIANELDTKLIRERAHGYDESLMKHHQLMRLNRWAQAEDLYNLYRKPQGFNEGDADYERNLRLIEDFGYRSIEDVPELYKLTSGQPQSWREYLDDSRRPSLASASKWMKLYRIFMKRFNFSIEQLADCSLERLYQISNYIEYRSDAKHWMNQATELSDSDWDKLLMTIKHNDEMEVEAFSTPKKYVVFEDASRYPEVSEIYRGQVVRVTIEPVTVGTVNKPHDDLLTSLIEIMRLLISGDESAIESAKKFLEAFDGT